MHADESFWCDRAGRSWIHGVWSVWGLPPHIVIEKIYAQRFAPRRRPEFPFVRFWQRTKAPDYGRAGQRLRGSGRIEADFVLPAPVWPRYHLKVTITFVDQVNRRYRARCVFVRRDAESVEGFSVSPLMAL
jgi:hypothetical protein